MSGLTTHTEWLYSRGITPVQVVSIFKEVANGRGDHGSFLRSFADAVVRADEENLVVLYETALKLICKYQLRDYVQPQTVDAMHGYLTDEGLDLAILRTLVITDSSFTSASRPMTGIDIAEWIPKCGGAPRVILRIQQLQEAGLVYCEEEQFWRLTATGKQKLSASLDFTKTGGL